MPNRLLATILLAIFFISSIVVHVLVLMSVIPYDWVNGGLSPSYEAQAVQSAVSIVVLVALAVLTWRIARTHGVLKTWQRRVLYTLMLLFCAGFILQLIGTPFERYGLSFTLLAGVGGYALLLRRATNK